MPSAHLSLLWLPTIVKALLEVLDGFRPRWILSKNGQAVTARSGASTSSRADDWLLFRERHERTHQVSGAEAPAFRYGE